MGIGAIGEVVDAAFRVTRPKRIPLS